jgi:hypothetical protein
LLCVGDGGLPPVDAPSACVALLASDAPVAAADSVDAIANAASSSRASSGMTRL